MPSRLVGTLTSRTPRSQVAATKPARSVVEPPPRPTTASERVKPALPSTDQQRRRDGGGLGRLGVRDVDPDDLVAGRAERRGSPTAASRISVGGWISATRCTSAPRSVGQLPEQVVADEDVVGPFGGDGDAGRLSHETRSAPPAAASTTCVGRPGVGLHRSRSRPRRRAACALASSLISWPRTLPSSSGPRLVQPDPGDGGGRAHLQPDDPVAARGPRAWPRRAPLPRRATSTPGRVQQLAGHLLLERPERRLAVVGEDLRDAACPTRSSISRRRR